MPKIITKAVIAFLSVAALAGTSAATPNRASAEPPPFAFYPQAGIPWQDLYFANFVDLDPGPGTLDWTCGAQTYDTHTGEDSIIRSFREKRIGVPVFAARDGQVIEVENIFPDERTAENMMPVDNHVIISSIGGHGRTVYGHLRRDVLVRRGQNVVAGQQIGYTASSGHSTWPHLHFTAKWDFKVYETFAGPCRPGVSYWLSQPQTPTAPYARDFTFSTEPFGGRRDPPWDEARRTGTFLRGERDLYFRVELAFFDGGPMHLTILRPDGSAALDAERPTPLQGYRATWASWHERLDLDQNGRWRLRLQTGNTTLVDAPFEVVSRRAAVRNRPPNPVSVELQTPTAVPQCVVHTSLVTEDPDYAIIRYRYRWRVGGKTVRRIRSSALSDVLRRNLPKPGKTLSCKVTPSDGKLRGRAASAAVRLG